MMNACVRCSVFAVPLLAALGCSDPVPLPAQGAITLSIQKATITTGGATCPDPGTTYRFGAKQGSPPNETILSPVGNNHGQSVVNGDQGSTISCSVRKDSAGNFAFSGSIQGTANSSEALTVSFTNGVITGETGTVGITIFTRKFSTSYSSPSAQPCTLQVVRGGTNGAEPQVKPGALWATFSCPSITAPPSGLCGVGATSAIVFENCEGT